MTSIEVLEAQLRWRAPSEELNDMAADAIKGLLCQNKALQQLLKETRTELSIKVGQLETAEYYLNKIDRDNLPWKGEW
jgi:hypothetical protein